MDLAEATRAIFKRWLDVWPTKSGGVPYVLDATTKSEAPVFARVAVISLSSVQATLGPEGNRRWDHTGLISVRLSCPIGQGRGQLDELAKVVTKIYSGKRLGRRARERGVVTHATSVNEERNSKEAAHRWILICATDFEFTERR